MKDWFVDLQSTMSPPQEMPRKLCPVCSVNEAEDCGHLIEDNHGEYDCTHPRFAGRMCDGCPASVCSTCRENGVVEVLEEEEE